ncbi:MAG TPA: SMC family ATPase [Mycobacteriales bacterium]|nr:SMC family ATPase [Mycobacteriales bacterium]
MRPHRLRMTAFGPFPGTVEVDLDRLAAGGLFLLHGETGAGKTTLLDGLGFALYGRVPGARQAGGRLRSDHAPAAVRTEVQLEVTLGGRRWRITRSPAQERPKARGTGMTTEQARVLLEQLRDGGWVAVSTRLDEAGQELDGLLGMSADQFFQVVLLPQGEFARFLRAESKERGQLLQRLFGTERFRAVEDWLAARRVATATALATAGQELQVLVARLAQAAGVDEPAHPPEVSSAVSSADVPAGWPAEVLDGALERAAAAARLVAAATTRRDHARQAASVAARLADRQARLRAADDTRRQLEHELPAYELLGVELSAADRAAELSAVLADAAARDAALASCAAAEVAARAGLPAVGLPAGAAPELLRQAAAQARERAGRLDGLRGPAQDLLAELDAATLAEQDARRCAGEAEQVQHALAGLPARRRAAQHRVSTSRAAADALPGHAAALLALRGALAESRNLAAVRCQLAQLRDEHLLARETAVSLRAKESELREARLTSMLAELADRLEPGVPCDVCGSPEHPDPYQGFGDAVSRDDEEHARAQADDAARLVAEVEARRAAADALAEGSRARLAAAGHAGAEPAQLEQQRGRLADEVDGLELAAADLDAALAALELLEQEQVACDADLARVRAAGEAAGRRAQEARARAARIEARLLRELDGAPDLPGALATVARLAAACDDVLDAVERARGAQEEATRATAAAADAAVAAGFAGPEPARAALRSAEWRAGAVRLRREHEDRVAAVAAALADPELAVSLDPPADLDGTAASLRSADGVLAGAVGELAARQGQVAQVRELVPRVDGALAGLVPLQDEAARARRLADLCAGGGGNALRMSLSSFVLAARLEEVAAAASGRLLRMTQGRYCLRHTDSTARGGVRSGLGLLVRDSWTGRDREPGTLSGGETFQASLALALGLADVVQAESGGTRIEALFVDEGFGSLDEQTLDEVMDVLDGLREGGRLVGLVSHVAELKARIPAQVHVRKARGGSTLTLEGC